MTANESLHLSSQIKDLLHTDLLPFFHEDVPVSQIEDRAREIMPESRDRIFTPCNVLLTMLLSATQEDKSIQNGLNIFKSVFEHHNQTLIRRETEQLQQEELIDSTVKRKPGRPKCYRSRLPKSCRKPLSDNTAGYSTARKRLDTSLVETVYEHSAKFGSLDKELWHGMETYITDGTYLQLQDTTEIKSQYGVTQESTYPQALLQVLIRQGAGYISQFSLGSRQQSELFLVIPMIRKLEKNSLLLADDLYNTYYHFCLILSQQCHMIVPGKRDRKHKVIREITKNDQIVEVSKTVCPNYVSKEDWEALPDKILLRRITYTYPTKNGLESAILYTTILDEKINSSEIITKYTMRWDIEISIREIKTIMDINVLRSKSRNMLFKELVISLTAYNLIRKLIAKAADKVGFPPQENIFQKYNPFGRSVLLDRKGRVFFKWSPGRYGYARGTNRKTSDSASKGEKTTLSEKN
jgi:hypothetical protein